MTRRAILQASGVTALVNGMLSCSHRAEQDRLARATKNFVIPEISWDRVIRTVVGLRPLRRSGFRVESEHFGEKTIVHNYGHGSRGVGMSWGTAHIAVQEAIKTNATRYAVAGCGAVGLASARLLQRHGFEVTIYAKDLPPRTTSNVAEAQFDPDVLPTDFEDVASAPVAEEIRKRYVTAVRLSHRYFQDMVGDYYGVRWLDVYRQETEERQFGRERNLLRDLYHYKTLYPGEHPFGSLTVVRETTLQIQTPIYLEALKRDFRLAGGRIIVREFEDAQSLLRMPEPVILNCTGLGAREIFGDEELVPNKGQITILLPQPEVDYGAFMMSPRTDGLLLHTGGYSEEGVWSLEPNEEVIEQTVNRAIQFWQQFS